ncbi:uncharacterized protein LOC124696433 [Lolium rigidum]|uniref:uncharacterized protein LOC124696433 n=1 Tax=Lolium rigidum TaxID=89674 RepID=UPI001F5C5D1F|nr:uncharacterized protein LOC124696433 [Lolium rigidum]
MEAVSGTGPAPPAARARAALPSQRPPPQDFTDLVLTGPHRAISADGGSFAVKVDLPSSDESDDVDGTTLWECDVDDTDSMVESSITTDSGNIVVTCAMLSNAVEATVHVNLTATTTTHVYGKIFAHIPQFRDEDNVVLFDRGTDEMVELAPSSSGSVIPLARSVVAVPIGSPLVIMKVSLHATTTPPAIAPVHEDTAIPIGGRSHFPLGRAYAANPHRHWPAQHPCRCHPMSAGRGNHFPRSIDLRSISW